MATGINASASGVLAGIVAAIEAIDLAGDQLHPDDVFRGQVGRPEMFAGDRSFYVLPSTSKRTTRTIDSEYHEMLIEVGIMFTRSPANWLRAIDDAARVVDNVLERLNVTVDAVTDQAVDFGDVDVSGEGFIIATVGARVEWNRTTT